MSGFVDGDYSQAKYVAVVVLISMLWWTISVSFTLYNKYIFQELTIGGKAGFNYPLTITAVHIFVKMLLSQFWACGKHCKGEAITTLSWSTHIFVLLPIGAMTAGDIVFSNLSITHLSLAMYTTVKSSTLIFTFIWGVLLKGKRHINHLSLQ